MKYIYEGLLIVFSVLFALFINKLYEDHKIRQEKETALLAIDAEIRRNQEVLDGWLKAHVTIQEQLQQLIFPGEEGLIRKDSLHSKMREYNFFNLGFLTDENLVESVPQHTAWETAKNTGITREFSFEEMELLTNVYGLQETMVEQTLQRLLDVYFARETHDPENFDETLLQFLLCFHELTGQERLMQSLYEKATDQMNLNNGN